MATLHQSASSFLIMRFRPRKMLSFPSLKKYKLPSVFVPLQQPAIHHIPLYANPSTKLSREGRKERNAPNQLSQISTPRRNISDATASSSVMNYTTRDLIMA